jgi:hypothetical protein
MGEDSVDRVARIPRRSAVRIMRLSILTTALVLGSIASATAQSGRCDTARQLLQSSLTKLQPGVGAATLEAASQNLRRATELCPGLGDAYYFLSLIALELKDGARAENWRRKAEFYNAPGLQTQQPLYGAVAENVADRNAVAPAADPTPRVPPLRVSPLVRQKLALVVGISRFKDPRINALKYTSRDAEAVAQALKRDCEFDYVKTLLDEQATSYHIKTEIDRIAKMADTDDLVVIYVSSHGSPEDLDTAGVNYVVTHDTEVSNLYPTAYRMDDLLDDIDLRVKAARVIAFLDTCYSGGTFRELPTGWVASSRAMSPVGGLSTSRLQERLARGARALAIERDGVAPATRGRVAQGIGRVIVTSSSQAERSWEDERIEHGYFTYYLLEALKRHTPVSVEDVFAHLRVKVPESVQRDKNASQHPGIARTHDRVNLYLKDRLSTAAPTPKVKDN